MRVASCVIYTYIHLLKKNRNLFSDANVNEKTNIGTTFGSFSPLEVRCSLAKIPFCYVESLIFKSDPYLIILKAKLPRALKICNVKTYICVTFA